MLPQHEIDLILSNLMEVQDFDHYIRPPNALLIVTRKNRPGHFYLNRGIAATIVAHRSLGVGHTGHQDWYHWNVSVVNSYQVLERSLKGKLPTYVIERIKRTILSVIGELGGD
jgi:hypothetical protein